MKKITKTFEIALKTTEKDKKVLVRISTDEVDRDGDVVMQNWDLPKTIPVIMFHDKNSLPIGRIKREDVVVTKEGSVSATYAKIEFASKIYDNAKVVEDLVRAGFLDKVSIGFVPKEVNYEDEELEGVRFVKSHLGELSFVIIPANTSAGVVSEESKTRIRKFVKSCGINGICDKYKNIKLDNGEPSDKLFYKEGDIEFLSRKRFTEEILKYYGIVKGKIKKEELEDIALQTFKIDLKKIDVDSFVKLIDGNYIFYKNLAESRKATTKLFRKMLKKMRKSLNLPVVKNEKKAIKQVFDLLVKLYKNSEVKNSSTNEKTVKIAKDSLLHRILLDK